MKYILFFCVLLSTLSSISAQEWLTDLDEAVALAAKEDKKVVLVFQGSDWCGPCIKLDKNVWSTSVFKTYAASNYVMLKADFPKRKKNKLTTTQQEKNNKLAETYNPSGYFPLVVVLDKNKNALGKTGYKKVEVNEYIALLNSF